MLQWRTRAFEPESAAAWGVGGMQGEDDPSFGEKEGAAAGGEDGWEVRVVIIIIIDIKL